jgi:DNA-binding NarL/FixJ family response regulator
MKLRVAIIEDDANFREGMRAFLETEPGFDVAAAFSTAEDLAAAAGDARREGRPLDWDVALMDIQMPGMSGIEATKALKAVAPDLPIVMLTVFEDPARILEAICAGADGYLLKKSAPEEIAEQLRAIVGGGSPLTAGVARTVLDLLRAGPSPLASRPIAALPVRLSDRELTVLRHLARGLSYKQVAAEESISLDTVRTHVRRLYRKLQVHSVAEAVAQAIRAGIV